MTGLLFTTDVLVARGLSPVVAGLTVRTLDEAARCADQGAQLLACSSLGRYWSTRFRGISGLVH